MSVRIPGESFFQLFKAAKTTVYRGKDDPISRCVYLHSARGEAEEVGTTDLLVATTTDGAVHGQMSVEVDGRFAHPLAFDMDFVASLTSHVKAAQKKMREEFGKQAVLEVELRVSAAPAGGEQVVVQTLTDGAPGEHDTSSSTNLIDHTEFPIRAVVADLVGTRREVIKNKDGVELPIGAAFVHGPQEVKVASAIQSVFGGELVLSYPLGHPANRRILVCNRWRGSVPGAQYEPDSSLDEPSVEVIVPPGSESEPESDPESDDER